MIYSINDILKSCVIGISGNNQLEIPDEELTKTSDSVLLTVKSDGKDSAVLSLKRISDGNSALFFFDAELKPIRERPNVFAAENAVKFGLNLPEAKHVLGNRHKSIWWMTAQFCNCMSELEPRTQSALIETGGGDYLFILPLNGENCFSEIAGEEICVSIGSNSYNHISGPLFCVSAGDDPYKVIENAYHFARRNGGIRGKLLEEKEWPVQLKGLGVCTWDMCYHDLTSEKIYAKLEELREKNIPVQWFLFDNGWLLHTDDKLDSFRENREKFPEGFAECVRRMKTEYGVKYVGVWHTFSGYWLGITPDGELYEEQKQNLEKMPGGLVIPSLDREKAFGFWDSWHTYLKSCGFDFVKVDSQSTYPVLCEGSKSGIEYCRSNQRALEESVNRHFGGAIINCMGMDMRNVLERDTAISRTSGDFAPKYPERFFTHTVQNVWNSLWHNQLYYSDFDMFWTSAVDCVSHESVLRAISGGPVYISDSIGITDGKVLRACVLEDGSLPVMDHAALPAKDIIFTDCSKEKRLFKIWNRCGDNFALALFTDDSVEDEKVELTCIPGIEESAEYLIYEYFTHSFIKAKGSESLSVSLSREQVRAYSVMPIKNGYVDWGDSRLYFPIADPGRNPVEIKTLINR